MIKRVVFISVGLVVLAFLLAMSRLAKMRLIMRPRRPVRRGHRTVTSAPPTTSRQFLNNPSVFARNTARQLRLSSPRISEILSEFP